MASVAKKGQRLYAILYPGNGRQKWVPLPVSVTSKKSAQRIANELQDEIDRTRLGLAPLSGSKSTGTFKDFAAAVIAEEYEQASEKRRLGWIPNLTIYASRFAEFAKDAALSSITIEDCRRYQAARISSKTSASTVKKEIIFIARVFRRALDHGAIVRNPWDSLKRPTERHSQENPPTPAEFTALLAASDGDHAFRYLFLAMTGARRSEARRVTWADVDFDGATCRIENASKGPGSRLPRFRYVPIYAPLLKAMKASRGAPGDPIFPVRHGWLRALAADCKAAGIRRLTLKDMRHAFGTWSAFIEVSPYELMAQMGHADLKTTMRYIHLAAGLRGGVPKGFGERLRNPLEGRKIGARAARRKRA